MKSFLCLLICFLVAGKFFTEAFKPIQNGVRINRMNMKMNAATSSVNNIPRKLQRKIRSVKDASGLSQVYTPEFEGTNLFCFFFFLLLHHRTISYKYLLFYQTFSLE
jgi:hypothetical protein